MHLVLSHRHKQVLVLNVPEHLVSLSLEVGDHYQTLIDWVEHVAVARGVDADALGASFIREHLL